MIEVSHKTDPLPFFVTVVPAIIERLGDSKQQVCFSLQEGFVFYSVQSAPKQLS